MLPEIVVRPEADRAFDEIQDYFAREVSPAKALEWAFRARETFPYLARNPGTGEPLSDPRPRLAGVRIGLVAKFPRYLVVYRPFADGIEILAVTHGARDLRRRL